MLLEWKASRPRVEDVQERSNTVFNRYPCGVLGAKDALCREMRRLRVRKHFLITQNVHGAIFDFTPLTFILPNEYR